MFYFNQIIYLGHTDTVELLVDNGADVNLADKNGLTSLHLAVRSGNFEKSQQTRNNQEQ